MYRWDYVKNENLAYLSLEEIKKALKHMYNGVWIRSDDNGGKGYSGHPCRWDFVDLSDVLEDEENTLSSNDISNGCYDDSDYEGLTLKQFLSKIRCFWLDGRPEESYVQDDKYAYAWNGKEVEEVWFVKSAKG